MAPYKNHSIWQPKILNKQFLPIRAFTHRGRLNFIYERKCEIKSTHKQWLFQSASLFVVLDYLHLPLATLLFCIHITLCLETNLSCSLLTILISQNSYCFRRLSSVFLSSFPLFLEVVNSNSWNLCKSYEPLYDWYNCGYKPSSWRSSLFANSLIVLIS